MTVFSRYLETLSKRLDSICRCALFVTLVAMIIVITAQIVFRVFFTALSWTEELSRYLLVWASFIGSAVAFKQGAHIAVSFAVDSLPDPLRKTVQTATCLLMATFFAVAIYYSIFLFNMQVFQVSPAIGIKMRYVYLIIPICFSVMSVHLLGQLLQIWTGKEQ